MILLGTSKQFGGTLVASPVEIVTSNPQTSIAKSRLLEWIDKRDRLQIEIKDDNYSKPIKIEFKSHYEEIKLWLTRITVTQLPLFQEKTTKTKLAQTF